jgi:hypothetical protein
MVGRGSFEKRDCELYLQVFTTDYFEEMILTFLFFI